MDVRTNIGKSFLKSITKHFPNGNSLHKIFNKNTFKVSYSCMSNMASIISSHNRTILNPDVSLEYGCNCRSRNECPLQNKCLTSKFASRADVENEINHKKKFIFGFLKQLSRSVTEITKKNVIMSNTKIAPNCPNTSGS